MAVESFSLQIEKWTEETQKRVTLAVRKIALDVFERIILKSPVDTGRFRGNWQVQIGSIPTGTLEIDDKSGQVTLAKAQAEVLGVKAGDTIYLINNLPYARRLEYGWSNQAPEGMVRTTVAEYQPIVDKVVREINNG